MTVGRHRLPHSHAAPFNGRAGRGRIAARATRPRPAGVRSSVDLREGRFLKAPHEPFQLIETMRWTRERGFYLRERHLDRLLASAAHFGFPCSRPAVEAALDRLAATLDGLCRVRLLLAGDGALSFEAAALEPASIERNDIRFSLSPRAVDSSDPFVRHKTTRRGFLDSERRRLAAETGCDEAIFVNERGELTEGSYNTLFLQRGETLLTPPLGCGLLDGTLRRELLAAGDPDVREEVLYPRDLESADLVWLGNSVRGLQRAQPAAHGATRPAGPARRARADDEEDRR